MADEMMTGQWPMPTEGRTHDPTEWVMVRKDDLLRAIEFVEAHHGELATSWYWGFRAVKERGAE